MNTHFFFATIYDEQTNLSDAIKSCRSLFFFNMYQIYIYFCWLLLSMMFVSTLLTYPYML